MGVINSETKDAIKKLSKADLEKLVFKAASKYKDFNDYLLVNFVDKEFGEQDLFEKASIEIEGLFRKSYKGFAEELQLANMLGACHKRINEFGKICKNKELELILVMKVLEVPFTLSSNLFCTCFTNYNYKVSLLLKKAISLLNNKLHEDYKIQYVQILNGYLQTIKRTSDYLDSVNNLPNSI